MANRRSHPGPDASADIDLARYDAALLVAPLKHLSSAVTCCFCGARTRDAELVRPIWGPQPCPQGHAHHPLEVAPRCRSCSEAESRHLEAHARAVARMQAALQALSWEELTPPPGGRPALATAVGPGRRPAAAAQASLF